MLFSGAIAAEPQACLPLQDAASALADDIAADVDVIPYRMALLPPDPESGVPVRVMENFSVALEAALRRRLRLADIIERRRIEALGRELGPERLARLQDELKVDGLLLVRARPAPGGAMVAVDGLELTRGALGQSFVTSLDHCLKIAGEALPLDVAMANLAQRAQARLEAAGAPLVLQTRHVRIGRQGEAFERVFEAFVEATQSTVGAGDGLARLTVEPVLRDAVDGHADIGLRLTTDADIQLLLSARVKDGRIDVPPPAGRVRATGSALIAGELDRVSAMQAARSQARAAAIALSVPDMAMPDPAPVSAIGTTRRNQAALARALTTNEHWTVAREDRERIDVVLETDVVVLGDAPVLIKDARLDNANLRDGERIFVSLVTTEPAYVALIGWFADGMALRAVPRQGQNQELVPAEQPLQLPSPDPPIRVFRPPGMTTANQVLLVIASRTPIDLDRLPRAAGKTLAESMARARPVEDVFDALAAMDADGLEVAVLPYVILDQP